MSVPRERQAGDGIDVGKAGITINLNGHTIAGSLPGYPYYGVYNDGFARVTIENGTVLGFEEGILDEYTTGSKVLNIKAHEASDGGISFWYSKNGVVEHLTGSYNREEGIYLYENTHVDVTSSKASHNKDGVYDYYSLSTLDKVKSSSNTEYGMYVESPVRVGSSYYTIENSSADMNGGSGVYVVDNYPTVSYQAIVRDNTADSNTLYGLYADLQVLGKGNHATNNNPNCWHVNCSK